MSIFDIDNLDLLSTILDWVSQLCIYSADTLEWYSIPGKNDRIQFLKFPYNSYGFLKIKKTTKLEATCIKIIKNMIFWNLIEIDFSKYLLPLLSVIVAGSEFGLK